MVVSSFQHVPTLRFKMLQNVAKRPCSEELALARPETSYDAITGHFRNTNETPRGMKDRLGEKRREGEAEPKEIGLAICCLTVNSIYHDVSGDGLKKLQLLKLNM